MIKPRTMILSSGTSLRASNEPERSSSYSKSKRRGFSLRNNSPLIASYPPCDSQRLPWLPRQT